MPESEKSFADRVQKSQNLHDACIGFSPAYLPAPDTITLAAFQTMITNRGEMNTDVNAADANRSAAATLRVERVALIKEATTHLIAYIKSVPAWKAKYPKAKKLADAIRGFKPPRKPLPAPEPGQPVPKRIQRGGESYAEIEVNFDSLVTLAITLPGFAPTNALITAPVISAHLSAMKALNKEVSLKESGLSEAQKVRYAGFFDKDGLKDSFAEVKGNVKGQYGPSSTQWDQVKGMRW